MASQFSTLFTAFLTSKYKATPEQIATLEASFDQLRQEYPDIPPNEVVSKDDFVAFEQRSSLETGETWTAFKLRAAQHALNEEARSDPFYPIWNGKTEDRPTMWVTDTLAPNGAGGLTINVPDKLKQDIEAAIRRAVPGRHLSLEQRLADPCDDKHFMGQLRAAISDNVRVFVHDRGSESASWKWGDSLATLAGLGLTTVRTLARPLSVNEGWDHLSTASTPDLIDDIVAAHNTSGYPVGLYRCDYHDLMNTIGALPTVPRWYPQVLLLHILKYTRIIPNYDKDRHAILVAYNGQYAIIPYQKCQHQIGLGQLAHKNTTPTLISVLGLPSGGTGRNATIWSLAAHTVLSRLMPASIATRARLTERPDILSPTAVTIGVDPTIGYASRFVNPGVVITGAARIDTDTRTVDKEYEARGCEVISLEWRLLDHKDEDLTATWRYKLPDVVPDIAPGQYLLGIQRNLNCLGHPRAASALLTGIQCANMIRVQLNGTEVGESLKQEFPIIMVYPMGYTRDTTTNQGKTALGRLLIRSWIPDFPGETTMNVSDSPPAMRTLCANLITYGTILLDEFKLPFSPNHVLNRNALQTACTGGGLAIGQANKNEPETKLKYSIVANMKVSALPPDMRNRQIPFFCDVITDTSRLSEEELALMTTGRAAMGLRVVTLQFIKTHNIIERLAAEGIASNKDWRFPAHLRIAAMFCPMEEIIAYLKAANAQCDLQLAEATSSGLVEELGLGERFELKWFWEQCERMTLSSLNTNATLSTNGMMPMLDVMRMLIEDGPKRRFSSVLGQHRIKERMALQTFYEQLQVGPLVRDEYILRVPTVAELDTMSESDRRRKPVFFENTSTPKVAGPTPLQTAKTTTKA